MRSSFQIGVFAAVLFAAGLMGFTRLNGFPFYYHPDEPGKVAQVQTGRWNFNHPMLLLATVRVAADVSGRAVDNPQRVAELGRTVSAGFAAGAAALLAATVWIAAGRFAGIAAGLLLLSHHQLFELSHYFKEDTALLFGMSAWLLGLALHCRRPGANTAALMGAGAALAVSGKYIGAVALLLSLALLPRIATARRGAQLAAFLGAFAVVFALVNLPLLRQLAVFESSFHREIGFVVKGQAGMTRTVPHPFYLNALRDNLHFALWIFPLLALAAAWRRRRALAAVEAVLLLLPLAYLLLLSFSPKTHDRYFLPCTALFLCAAALGMARLREHARWGAFAPALLGLAVLLQVAGLPRHDLRSYYRAFQSDDRAELATWLNTHHPHAVIAQDRRTLLPVAEAPRFLPYQPALSARVIAQPLEKIADLDALRSAGVTLAALCQDDYGRYDVKSLRPQRGAEAAYRQTGALYRALRESGAPLWQRPRGLVTYLHPGLCVYAVPPQ